METLGDRFQPYLWSDTSETSETQIMEHSVVNLEDGKKSR